MFRNIIIWLLIASMSLCCNAQEMDFSTPIPTATPIPIRISATPLLSEPPISLRSPSVLLAEANSGQIIFMKNGQSRRQAASVNKVMTILLTLEAIDSGRISIDQNVTISATASGMGGSQILLDTGEIQPVGELLKSVIVGSANDSAVALAECLYGSEALFVERMNERAVELGMSDTKFVNCTGLPADGQYTTAYDVAVMTLAMLRHPLYYTYSRVWTETFDHGSGRVTQLTNTNKLLRQYDGCDGGKTGSTKAAGYCVSATAQRGDLRFVAVILGGNTSSERFDDAKAAFDYGFANYRLYPVAQSGTKIRGEVPVEGGNLSGVALELAGELTLLLRKGDEQRVQLLPILPEKLYAPIAQGEQVGFVRVAMDDAIVGEIPVVTARDVRANGLGSVMRRLFRHWAWH